MIQQWFQCPRCGVPVAFGVRFCGNCGTQLNWPTQQQTQSPPVYQQPQQQWNYDYLQPRKEPKKTSPSLIGCLAFIAIVFLIGGAIFVANSGLRGTPPVVSPTTSEPTDISTAPAGTPASEPEERGCEALPEYVQQYTNQQPLYARASGQGVHLSNNASANDVSFAKLKSFILQDDTDEETYVEGVRICGDFAETLHNNAERAGIRAAFVAVNFAGEEVGHALDAFCTTDRGLVYIDCTGPGFKSVTYLQDLSKKASYPCERDKVAYVEAGKEFGVISIDKAESPQYGFYFEYAQNWQKYDDMLGDYNNEVTRYNQEISRNVYYEGSPELARMEAWEAELAGKERVLDGLAEKLGNCGFESLGIVETVEIYW